jgi:hypothetical protein
MLQYNNIHKQNKVTKNLPFLACHLLTCWFLLELFFDPEDGGDMFLRNVGCNSTDYTASHPTAVETSNPPFSCSSLRVIPIKQDRSRYNTITLEMLESNPSQDSAYLE